MNCTYDFECYQGYCLANDTCAGNPRDQLANMIYDWCTRSLNSSTNRCPFTQCTLNSQCHSFDCHFSNDDDCYGICATSRDQFDCTTNASAPLNRCNGISCDRDRQCASFSCGKNGHNSTCSASSGMPTWAIVLIVVFLVLVTAGVAVYVCYRRRKNQKEKSDADLLISARGSKREQSSIQ